jgi:hypothetical protein
MVGGGGAEGQMTVSTQGCAAPSIASSEANDVDFVGDGVNRSTKLGLVALGDFDTASKVHE